MVRAAAASEDRRMFPDTFIPRGQVPATAARLHRAAAELRERAGSQYAVPTLPITLAHLEDAFDELAATMRLLAEGAAEWCGMDDADAGTLPPEASALLWHLRSVADSLTHAGDGCLASRPWAHQLLERADVMIVPERAAEVTPPRARTGGRAPASRR